MVKFRMSYSGWVKAGYSTLHVKDALYKNDSVYHVIGKGKTLALLNYFLKLMTDMKVILIKKS